MAPPKRTAPVELTAVRELAAQLAAAEQHAAELREQRNAAMRTAKVAGATGDQLATAAGMTRRKAVDIVNNEGTQ